MKRKLGLMLVMLIIMTSMAIGAFAADASSEGYSFASNQLWEVNRSFNELPTRYEATIYPTDTTVESVIFGNFVKSYGAAFDFRLGAGGIPTLILNQAKGEARLDITFDDAAVPANEWTKVTVEYDEAGLTASCYLNGTLASTVDLTGKTIPSVLPNINIVIGGNRAIGENGVHNLSYFRGYISTASAYVGENALFEYEFGGEGNTAKLMKDQSGNGNDAIFSNVWNATSGIENSGETYAYTFAVVGDPQTISQSSYKDSYLNMYKWIVEQDPSFVMTLGDIIQNGAKGESETATAEWLVATEALGYLDAAKIPHSDSKGNHCTRDQVNKYLTYEKYGNAFEEQGVKTICYEKSMLNAAYLFTVKGINYMVLALEYGPSEAVLGWAGQLCEIYRDYNVIITTHSYMTRDGTTISATDGGDALEADGFTTGDEIYNYLVDKYSNIVLVLCGHISHDNVVVTQRENSVGAKVTEILIDFQDVDGKVAGNVGMVNMFNFSEDGKTVYIETYSTAQKAYYKDINQIKLTLNSVTPENEVTPAYGEQTASGEVSGYSYTVYGDTLVISGKGTGVLEGTAPALSGIKTVVLENTTAIKEIGGSFFASYGDVETVVIPEALVTIGSKAFANMPALKTVALFNEYYAADFAGTGIIDIDKVFNISSDSFAGSCAAATAVYISEHAEISGTPAALTANADAVYYTYPSGNAARYMRSLGDTVKHEYYTAQMTGDETLSLTGTAARNGKNTSVVSFSWTFDPATGTLTTKEGGWRATRMHGETGEFDNWKRTWGDLVKVLSIGTPYYSMWESYDMSNSIPYGLVNLETIKLPKKLLLDDRHPLSGFFENCSSLKSIVWSGSPDVEEGVIDLTWWSEIRQTQYDGMFRNCTSVTGVVFPETISKPQNFSIFPSMFENCVNLKSIDIPSYATVIHTDAFKNCSALSSITIPATITEIDAGAFGGCSALKTVDLKNRSISLTPDIIPDNEGLTITVYTEAQYNAMSEVYENATVEIVDSSNLMIDESGFEYRSFEGVVNIMKGDTTVGTTLTSDIEGVFDGVTTLIIDEESGITAIDPAILSDSITTIVLPSTVTELGDGMLANAASLKTLVRYNDYMAEDKSDKFHGGEFALGLIDLRGFTSVSGTALASLEGTSPIVYLDKTYDYSAEALNALFGDCGAVKYYSFPTCPGATAVRNIAKKNAAATLAYYPETMYSELVRQGTDGTYFDYWKITEDGDLTLDLLKDLTIKGDNPYLAWKEIWRDAILSISVTGWSSYGKYTINGASPEGVYDHMPNLVSIRICTYGKYGSLAKEISIKANGLTGMFEGDTSLTTVVWGSTLPSEPGIYLDGLVKINNEGFTKAFRGCTSITNFVFGATAPTNSKFINAGMFEGCTSLTTIKVPSYVTVISADAFKDCTSLKSIVLEGDTAPTDLSGIPDQEDLVIICKTAEIADAVNEAGAWTNTKAVYFDGEFDGSISMDGFSIRLKGYNGLRGMFSFDTTKNAIFESAGYTLVEYGAIAMSESVYNSVGAPVITLENGTYVSNAGLKVRAYSAEEGFKLDDGKDAAHYSEGDLIRFNVALVRFSANHNSNVYMCAYSVYTDPNGETVITYKHYSDDYKFFNLYDLTLGMYKAGAINASVSDDKAVWNTLLTGAVTIESGDVYKEIPAVTRSASSVYKPVEGVTVTLVIDTDDTSFVAIYRGEGAIPVQNDGGYSNGYGRTSANQLGPTIRSYTVAEGYDPIPLLSDDEVTLVKTIIMDHGITSISKYGFVGLDYATTYVYPTTLKSIDQAAFFYNTGITTAFCAHVDDPNKVNVEGLCDFSMVESCNLASMFRTAVNIKKLHLPGTVTKAEAGLVFGNSVSNGNMALEKVWFGNNPEPAENIADLSNITVSGIGSKAFMACTNLTGIILPDGCASISADSFNGSPKSTYSGVVMGNFKTVTQHTYNAAIAEYCTTNGLTYNYTTGGPTT